MSPPQMQRLCCLLRPAETLEREKKEPFVRWGLTNKPSEDLFKNMAFTGHTNEPFLIALQATGQ